MSKPQFDQKWLEDYDLKRAIAKARPRAGAGLSSPVTEQVICHEPLGEEQGKEEGSSRPCVCIISLRTRLIDPDNMAGAKFLLDALRYAGVIKDDRAADIDLRLIQQKVKKVADEKTIIAIYTEPVPW